jgi:hypothetical protein
MLPLTPVKKIDQRPAWSSCAACRAPLGLASVKVGDVWYCSSACAQGRPSATSRRVAVPEPWLYNRPRRHFRKRLPKELRSADAPPRARAPVSAAGEERAK